MSDYCDDLMEANNLTITAGTKLGRYEIRAKICEGGMGEVYRARDEKLNRDESDCNHNENHAKTKNQLSRLSAYLDQLRGIKT